MTGYKVPPTHTQFKKGQSGNPNGRPKKAETGKSRLVSEMVLKEAERPIKVREGDELREITAIEAVRKAQYKTALSGSSHAQKEILNDYGEAVRAEEERRKEVRESWRRYKEIMGKHFDDARQRGEPEPAIYPHPDDVVIDDKEGVSILGPVNEEQAKYVARKVKIRDAYILQYAHDEKLRRKNDKADTYKNHSCAIVLAQQENGYLFDLSRRDYLSDIQMASKIMHLRGKTKRWLLKEKYQVWKALGMPVRRGSRFISVGILKQAFELRGIKFPDIS